MLFLLLFPKEQNPLSCFFQRIRVYNIRRSGEESPSRIRKKGKTKMNSNESKSKVEVESRSRIRNSLPQPVGGDPRAPRVPPDGSVASSHPSQMSQLSQSKFTKKEGETEMKERTKESKEKDQEKRAHSHTPRATHTPAHTRTRVRTLNNVPIPCRLSPKSSTTPSVRSTSETNNSSISGIAKCPRRSGATNTATPSRIGATCSSNGSIPCALRTVARSRAYFRRA